MSVAFQSSKLDAEAWLEIHCRGMPLAVDVDLIYVVLKMLLSSVETAGRLRSVSGPREEESGYAVPICNH